MLSITNFPFFVNCFKRPTRNFPEFFRNFFGYFAKIHAAVRKIAPLAKNASVPPNFLYTHKKMLRAPHGKAFFKMAEFYRGVNANAPIVPGAQTFDDARPLK